MASLREDLDTAAAWISEAASSSDYRADFSPASVIELDRFFLEHSRDSHPISGGLLAEHTGARLFAFDAYLGEVIRRSVGGEWCASEEDPDGEIDVRLPDGSEVFPVRCVMARLVEGPERSLAACAAPPEKARSADWSGTP